MSVPDRSSGAARVLHTSDWHLGVTVRGHSRREDHAAVIDEIVSIAEEARPDLVVHTGDLFDGHRPAMAEFGDAITSLRRLADVAPVVLLAGNHDSAGVFEVLALALEDWEGMCGVGWFVLFVGLEALVYGSCSESIG